MADNETIARSLYDAWNRRDFDQMVATAAPDSRIVMIGSGDTYEGKEGTRRYGTMWAEAFPDAQITIDSVVAQETRWWSSSPGPARTPAPWSRRWGRSRPRAGRSRSGCVTC